MDRRMFMKNGLLAVLGTGLTAQSVLFPHKMAHAASAEGDKKMKILVLTGSPRKNGNSNTLADNFIKGATEKGHEVVRFDAAEREVHPCIACNSCGMDGPCVFDDDFEFVRKHIIDAKLVVLQPPCIISAFPLN